MAALLIHGVPPGPQLVNEHPQVFWGFIASMYVGNLMLLALNLPLVGLFVQRAAASPTPISIRSSSCSASSASTR